MLRRRYFYRPRHPNSSQWERFIRAQFRCNGRETRGVNTHMNLKTPRDKIRWFGEFEFQAVAADSIELASGIEDFVRDYPLARGRGEGLRYMLHVVPLGRRMHQVSVEPSAPDGAILEARIPVGRPVSRRAQLTTIGWALERASSGTRYYTRRFIASDAAPTDIVTAVDQANRVLYGSRANDIRWSLNVLPQYAVDEAKDGVESRPERPTRRRHAVTALVMAGIALWVSERVTFDEARFHTALPPVLTAAIVMGGTTCALLVYLSGIPSKWGARNAEFLGGGALTRFAVEASFSVVAALIWSFALVSLFGPSR